MYRAIVMEMSSCTNKKKKKSKLHKEEGGDVIISKTLLISAFGTKYSRVDQIFGRQPLKNLK